MHPHVAEHKNLDCIDFIRALEECHSGNPWKKFLGKEFEDNRKKQLESSRKKRADIEKKWKEIEENR
ncbi:hypothetical protein BB558_001942 [Smittium angustum]|uniref:COX assembly mitochondrial protein n=1 Tax=Smittium angustum TaxID=133377 RepID=A0A2U1J9Y3_SMIAN|nr:hypothetical protein BB558_001942 [Smittium angustum]